MLRRTRVENGILQGIPSGDPRITVYKGVPYAAPPVGELRWKAPQPVKNWEGVRMADRFAPIAPQGQQGVNWAEFYTKEIHPCGYELEMSEDCLYLNVWTPAMSDSERLPVFFWIHGGGLSGGYSYEMEFDGERVARKGCVVVSIAYRLGGLGFFAHDDLDEEEPGCAQGNFGLLDQAAAIAWAKRNIAAFGGDPDRIVIAGQSAGGRSVTALMTSPMTKNLISGAILMSGGGIAPSRTLADAKEEGRQLLRALDVNSVDEARRLPADLIIKTMEGLRARPGAVKNRSTVCIDGVFLQEDPTDVILGNRLPNIPYLFGFCHDEGFSFFRRSVPETMAAFEEKIRAEYGEHAERFFELAGVHSDEELAKLYGSEEFHPFYMSHGCLARVLAEQGRPAYMYMFDHDMPGDDVGSYHGSDLWFFFDALNRCWRPFAGKHYDLARQVCRYVVNFCATGDPNGADHDGAPLPRWDGYTEQAPMMMVFGDVPEQRRAPVEGELTRLRQEQFMGRLKK